VDEAGRCGRHTDAVEREGDDEVLSRLAVALLPIHRHPSHHRVGLPSARCRPIRWRCPPCADGDADVGLREGGCVIDAVPDHRHAVTVILRRPISSRFSSGRTSAITRSIPTSSATACAVRSLSPVIITGAIPASVIRWTVSVASAFSSSPMPSSPTSTPSRTTPETVRPRS